MYKEFQKEEAKQQEENIAQIKAFEASTVKPSKIFDITAKYGSHEDVLFSKEEKEQLLRTKPSGTTLSDDEFITECKHLIAQYCMEVNWLSNSETKKRLTKANNHIKKALKIIGELDNDTQILLTSNFKDSLFHLFNKSSFKSDIQMSLLPQLLLSMQCAIELSTNKKKPNQHSPYVKRVFENLVYTWESVFKSQTSKTEGKFKEFIIIMFSHFGHVYSEPEKRIEEAIRSSRELDQSIQEAI